MDLHPLDLQIQTTASDGKHTPAECVRMAKENGVHTMAITDHDTVAGVAEAVAAGAELGVRVIPGIEISALDHRIHILGLGVDAAFPPLLLVTAKFRKGRVVRAQQMVEGLRRTGFVVEWEDVLREAGSAIIASPHVVGAIMKRPENEQKLLGVTTKHEFYERFLTSSGPYYVPAASISAREAIALIHGAGGVAVWSHPPIPDFAGNCAGLGEFLQELIAAKIDGLELFGPSLTDSDFACLEDLARRHHLLVTAGSDFHETGPRTDAPWPRSAWTIGDYPIHGRSLDGIIPALDEAMARRSAVVSGG